MDLVEGGVFNFTVVAKNRHGTVVPINDAAVALDDPNLGTVAVNPDGSAGSFTANVGVTGNVNLTPSAKGVTGTPFPLSVVADLDVVTVELVPVVDGGVTSVEIQPA